MFVVSFGFFSVSGALWSFLFASSFFFSFSAVWIFLFVSGECVLLYAWGLVLGPIIFASEGAVCECM